MANAQDEWLKALGAKFPDAIIMPEDEIKAKPPSSSTVGTTVTTPPHPSAPAAAAPKASTPPPASASPASTPSTSPKSPGAVHEASSTGGSWRFSHEFKGQLAKFGDTSKFKGSIDLKGEITAELAPKGASTALKVGPTTNIGLKAEFEIAKQKADSFSNETVRKIFTALRITEIKETLKIEGSRKKCDISAAMTGKIATPWPWLTGAVEAKFTVAGWEWEKIAKNPDDVTVAGLELSGGPKGEGTIPLTDSYELKIAVKGVVAGSLKPNWPIILQEGAKKFGEEAATKVVQQGAKEVVKDAAEATVETAATTATEGIVVDMAAVTSAAAAVVLPLTAAAAIGFGLYQESKLMKADAEAIQTGLATRARMVKTAESFASVMVGARNKGDEGGQLADAEINRIMAQTHATRQQVTDAASRALGGYQKIRDTQLERLRDKLYEDACRIFDESHKSDFGFIEKQGETWGFRGSYRKTLRLILYSDN